MGSALGLPIWEEASCSIDLQPYLGGLIAAEANKLRTMIKAAGIKPV